MPTPTRRRNATVNRASRGAIVGVLMTVACLGSRGRALAQIENLLMLPHAEVTVGDADSTIDVLCDHDFALVAFSIHLVFDASKIRITDIEKGSSVENRIPDQFFFWNIESDAVSVGAILDISALAELPAGVGHSLLTLHFEVLAAPGESVDLIFEDEPGPAGAVNRLSTSCPDPDDPCIPLLPALQNGSVVALLADEITVYAGPDRLGAENETVELNGLAWSPDPQLPLSFRWSSVSGPTLVDPVGETTPTFGFTLPPVDGDQPIVIELEVDDTVHPAATDLVIVDVVDLNLRQASVEAPAGEVRVFDDGRRAVVYAGEITWDSTEEDATWTEIEFSTLASTGSSATLDFATLYIDRDGDGLPGAGDTELGSAPIDTDSAVLLFQFSEPLTDGDRLDLLLVVDLADGTVSAAGTWILALLIALALAGGRRRISLAISGALAIAALALLPLACSHGSGGHGPAPAAPASEVRFKLDPASVVIHGQTTGVSIPVSGGTRTGPALGL